MLKNHKKLFAIQIFILLFGFGELYSQYSQPIMPAFIKKNKDTTKKQMFDFRINTDISTASMRYDKNGNSILTDTVIYIDTNEKTFYYPYTTDFAQQKYNFIVGYLGVRNLYCYVNFPLIHSSVSERFKLDSTLTVRTQRNKGTKFYFEGSQIDAGYTFDFDFLNITVLGSVFFPFYKYSSTVDTTDDYFDNKNIQLGRVFETSTGTKFDFNFENSRLQLGGIYNQRSEDFSDRLMFNLLFGLSSVENTELFANLKYIRSISDFKEKYQIDFWRQALWENYFDMNLGFTIFFTDEFYANLGYVIRLWGENTLSQKTVNINLGYVFRK